MGRYDFDRIIDRHGTNSAKWDSMDQKYGRTDLIHLGIADMDFAAPPAILDKFHEITREGIFGYTDLSEGFYDGIIRWFHKYFETEIKREWIVFCPKINIACGICVNEFSAPSDQVMIHTPAYGPLMYAIIKNDRELLRSPLVRRDNSFVIDFEQMEKSVTPKTKILILCSPQNPTTRIFSNEELIRLGEFCIKHDLLLFTDEIHRDIMKKGFKPESVLKLDEKIKDRLILASSLTKTFNVPGVVVSYMVIPNESIRNRVMKCIDKVGIQDPGIFALAAIEKGYTECDGWYEEMLSYIDENEILVRDFFEIHFKELLIMDREGTYLLWIDYSPLGINEKKMEEWLVEKANVVMCMGGMYGEEGNGYFRLNLAAPKAVLKEAMERMLKVYHLLI